MIESFLAGELGQVLVVRLPGQVTDETSGLIVGEVRSRLPKMEGAGLVLDCRDVTLINSIGITCFLQVQDLCRQGGAGMVLGEVPERIVDFLGRLKLLKRFPVVETVDEGVRGFEEG